MYLSQIMRIGLSNATAVSALFFLLEAVVDVQFGLDIVHQTEDVFDNLEVEVQHLPYHVTEVLLWYEMRILIDLRI